MEIVGPLAFGFPRFYCCYIRPRDTYPLVFVLDKIYETFKL